MAKKTRRIAKIDKAIAEAEHDETYLKYLIRIKKMTVHIEDGGQFFMNSGSPPPLPPY